MAARIIDDLEFDNAFAEGDEGPAHAEEGVSSMSGDFHPIRTTFDTSSVVGPDAAVALARLRIDRHWAARRWP